MARYTCTYLASVHDPSLEKTLVQILQASDCELIYQISDYLMGRENPGQVKFAQLATVEILLDQTRAKEDIMQVHFVVKNEELPLQRNNHCQQMFERVQANVAELSSLNLMAETSNA
ncbi:MAG: hypothetical protein AAGG02_21160 [Cyanobacteria bacterium P01_H01_bin.15]